MRESLKPDCLEILSFRRRHDCDDLFRRSVSCRQPGTIGLPFKLRSGRRRDGLDRKVFPGTQALARFVVLQPAAKLCRQVGFLEIGGLFLQASQLRLPGGFAIEVFFRLQIDVNDSKPTYSIAYHTIAAIVYYVAS